MNFLQLFDDIAAGRIATVAGVGYRDGIPAKEADAGWPLGIARRLRVSISTPPPLAFSALTQPLWSSATLRTIASPLRSAT